MRDIVKDIAIEVNFKEDSKECPARLGMGRHKEDCYLFNDNQPCYFSNCPIIFWIKKLKEI